MAGWVNARRRNRRLDPCRRVAVAGVLPILIAAALAGCGQSSDDALSSSAAEGATTAAPDPGGQATATNPLPTPTADGATGDGGAAGSGTDSGGEAGGTGGTGGSDGAGGAGASGTPGADGTDSAGRTGPSTSDASAAPTPIASPVFVGEPCAPDQDTAPATAINGLTLYCAASSPGSNGQGSWSDVPSQQQQQGPTPGAECDSSDLGHVQQDSSGRPVACLREPSGEFRWADIS